MNRSLYNWLYRDSLSLHSRTVLLFISFLVLVAASGGGTWYYFHAKAAQKAEQQTRQAQALQQKKAAVTAFYTTAMSGTDVQGFLRLYDEILRSRLPVMLSGFSQEHFSCTADSCDFSYQARDSAIFNIQQKQFRGAAYAPSFSPDTVDYNGIPSGMDSSPLLTAFRQQAKISLASCNDILNYLYGYNSLVAAGQRFTLTQLPASSVTADEESLPGNPENYGLLAGKWQVSLPDDYVSVFSFWRERPYFSSFIFQSVASKQGILDLSGTFLCKK